ncbi:MAG: penicillin acylase family protein [Desulfobacterales bacterium]|jgi:acyl-homoserine lactone acylase PvdQ
MKRFYKIILFTLVLVAALMAGSIVYLHQLKPQYSGELVIEGLNQQVDVYFDPWTVPHIYARNEVDAYFALGYVHAQERLFQMEIMRRIAAGQSGFFLSCHYDDQTPLFNNHQLRLQTMTASKIRQNPMGKLILRPN